MFPLIALLVLSATFYFTVQFIAARNRRQGAKIPPGPKGKAATDMMGILESSADMIMKDGPS